MELSSSVPPTVTPLEETVSQCPEALLTFRFGALRADSDPRLGHLHATARGRGEGWASLVRSWPVTAARNTQRAVAPLLPMRMASPITIGPYAPR